METSETLGELSKALVKFQTDVPTIKKDASNPFFKSKYASLENIITTIKEGLASNGLAVSQFPTSDNELTTILMHTSGEWIRSTVRTSPKDSTPQGVGSAITYMRRYALSAVLGLATDEDDDGNAASQAQPAAKQSSKSAAVPVDAFKSAKSMIDQSHDAQSAIAVGERIEASTKFTKEQKQELQTLVERKVTSFDNSTA